MKKNFAYLFTFLLIIGVSDAVMGQAHKSCGMKAEDLAEVKRQMLENRRELANFVPTRNVVTYVPIRWHLVANAAGEGRATERQALQALCKLNTNYEEQEVQFYIEEFNYIDNNTIYNNPEGFSGAINLSANMTYDAVNIFVVGPEVGVDPNDPASVVQAYYQPPAGAGGGRDWIVCNKTYLTYDYVLTHEMGHFLSLSHPFSGWDSTPWDPDVHGNPVTFNNAPDGGQVELVNGSNCNTAGDAICDTPADYNFGLTYNSSSCNYIGNCRDANNELLVPLEENVMNYFGCNTQTFTDGQKAEVQNSLNSNNRNYCTPDYTPVTDEITGGLSLIYPSSQETTNNYNYVNLQWEAKAGATHYIVEVAGSQIFTMIAESNNLELTNLQSDKTYLWRVTPFNESYGCANSSSQQIFKTGENTTSTTDVKEISDWTVAPNPVSTQEKIRVSINASETFAADLVLVDLTGKTVRTLNNQVFAAGNSVVEVSVVDLPTGIYTLAIQSENGVSNQRIVVTK